MNLVEQLKGKSRPRRKRGRRGYTVMEVMMALAVLAVGATGVVAMQKTAVIGNMRARNLATANAIGATWLERLRADGASWARTANGGTSTASTRWLRLVGDDYPAVSGNEGVWVAPQSFPNEGISAGADVRGVDTTVAADQGFCTHIRLRQVLPGLIRAEVRVFWLRKLGGGTVNGQPLCSETAAYIAAIGAAQDRYHQVYFTTGILVNEGNGA